MSRIEYSFQSDYSNLSAIDIPFIINDRFGNNLYNTSLSAITGDHIFTGNFGGITVYPIFDTAPLIISDNDFFIDFGDGTIIREKLSASHTYNSTGDYPITLVVTTSTGSFFKSKSKYIAKVRNVIPDRVYLTFESSNQQNRSEATSKLIITRFNSSLTSPYLSANNYSINLAVKNNEAPLIRQEKYIDNEYFQFKPGSYFITSPDEDFEVINSVKTTSTNIYAKYQGAELILETTSTPSNEFVGTSGYGSFYYIEN
jgi:hypothetical protein